MKTRPDSLAVIRIGVSECGNFFVTLSGLNAGI